MTVTSRNRPIYGDLSARKKLPSCELYFSFELECELLSHVQKNHAIKNVGYRLRKATTVTSEASHNAILVADEI